MIKNRETNKSIKSANKLICLIVAIISVIAVLFAISKKMDFMFISNDDIYIRAILSGDLTGIPDGHAIYILYPLAWILASLYKLAPLVNWYGIFTIGIHSACWVLVLYRISSLGNTLWTQIRNFMLMYFFLIFLDLQYLVYSQYTVLAGIIGCTAIFWFVTTKNADKWTEYVPVVVLLGISFLIRSQAALMCIPFIICFGLYKIGFFFFEKKDKGKTIGLIKRYVVLSITIGLLLGGLFSIHQFAYQADEWKQYKEYNKYRTQVYDFYSFPSYEENTEFYNSLGIGKEEMYLIKSANLGIDENITVDKMKAIYLKSKEIYKWNEQFYSVPRKIVFDYLDSFKDISRGNLLLFMLYGVSLFLAFFERKNVFWIGFATLFVGRSILRCYLLYRGRFPERVSYPLTIAEILVLVGIIYIAVCQQKKEDNIKREKSIGHLIGIGILSCFMLLLIIDVYKENIDRSISIKGEIGWVENLFPYLENNPKNNYLLEVQSTATLKAPIFGEYIHMPENAIYVGGWLQKSPLIKLQYERRLHTVLQKDVLEDNSTFIIQKSELSIVWLEEYFKSKDSSIKANVVDYIELSGERIYSIIQVK